MTTAGNFATSIKLEMEIKERWNKYVKKKGRYALSFSGAANEGLDTFLEKEGF